jgi:ATP-dependent DNA helicase RecG
MRLRFVVYLNSSIKIETTGLDRAQDGAQDGAQEGAQFYLIIYHLQNFALSAKELIRILGLKSKTGAFKRAVKEMLDNNLVEYTIPNKPTSRYQKYRLTDRGKDWLIRNKLFEKAVEQDEQDIEQDGEK